MGIINITKVAHFSGHKGAVYALERAVDKNCFYSGGSDGYIVSWNYDSKSDGKLIAQVHKPIYSLYLNVKNNLLCCGTSSGNLHIINLDSGKELRNIEAHKLGVFDLKMCNDLLLTAGGDGKVKIWKFPEMVVVKEMEYSDKSARTLAIDEFDNKLVVGYSDYKIRLFNMNDYNLVNTINAHNNSVFSIALNKLQNEMISGGRDAMLRSWSLSNYEIKEDVPAHTLHINHIALNPDVNIFATVSMDKTIKIWDAGSFQLLKVINNVKNNGHMSSVNRCLWLDNAILATCSDDKTVMVWNINYQP